MFDLDQSIRIEQLKKFAKFEIPVANREITKNTPAEKAREKLVRLESFIVEVD